MTCHMDGYIETHPTASDFLEKLRTFGSIVTKATASDRCKVVETCYDQITKSEILINKGIKVFLKNSAMYMM